MADAHVRALRLFDLARFRKKLQLLSWEKDHLDGCEECQQVLSLFVRQVTHHAPMFINGELNPEHGWYATACCDWVMYVAEGRNFAACKCRKHKNVPTIWKQVTAEKKESA